MEISDFKGPLAAKNIRLMVTKFEETGSLNVRSGRRRKLTRIVLWTENIAELLHSRNDIWNAILHHGIQYLYDSMSLRTSTLFTTRNG
ncbi:hypothetical protein TNCT_495481 [Trichonephila clavata]|uniref:Uncharacterized protein n=1 Tax=Trichonephila clavata TaxID=2740835 RepID=A0A8X6HDA5_TRICU|nr:hypothetical protein TNCT_495481 [Trichonephila clavata]